VSANTRPIDITLHSLLTIDARQFESTPPVGRELLIRDLALSDAAGSLAAMGQALEDVTFGIEQFRVYAPSQAMAVYQIKGYAVRVDVRVLVKALARAA
jgi:hypothetical protein